MRDGRDTGTHGQTRGGKKQSHKERDREKPRTETKGLRAERGTERERQREPRQREGTKETKRNSRSLDLQRRGIKNERGEREMPVIPRFRRLL